MHDPELDQLASQIGQVLKAREQLLVTAESCTGGWIAEVITSVPGSSAWFDRGFVSYSNLAKQQMLGVDPNIISVHGAVSEATVRAMAEGALIHSSADIALAVSGIAGPGGGSNDKPVGTVCFAWAARNGVIKTATQLFSGDRYLVRRLSVIAALNGLLG